jgi:hypothetical protein
VVDTARNPILARLEQAHDTWTAFARDPDARLLIWTADDNEYALLDAFVAQECAAEAATTPDLFVHLQTPFEGARHGCALARELIDQYDELARAGVEGPLWRPPATRASDDDVETLITVLTSFRGHHVPTCGPKLALWLDPRSISAHDAYTLWLQRAALRSDGALRWMIVAEDGSPECALAKVHPREVSVRACDFDLPGALVQLANDGSAEPGARFRGLQAQLAQQLAAGDLRAARELATGASALALAQGWPLLAASTQMMFAASSTAAHEALAAYAEADRLAALHEELPSQPAALARRVRLQLRFGQGAVLLRERVFKLASDIYEQAAQLAEALAEPALAIDALRLASLCHDQVGQTRQAWTLGERALKLACGLDAAALAHSSTPSLAQQMLAFCERHPDYAHYRRPLESRVSRLLGSHWREAN